MTQWRYDFVFCSRTKFSRSNRSLETQGRHSTRGKDLQTTEIVGCAVKIIGVVRAANLIKKDTYIGIALEVAATGLEIHKACTAGRDNECRKAKYVHGSSLTGSVAGGGIAASYGGTIATSICLALGVPTAGTGALLCAVIGGAAGATGGSMLGGAVGEALGEVLYEKVGSE